MLKHLEISNPDSCLNKSENDEPVFVICARDPLAAEIIREWAVRYIALKGAGGQAPTEGQAIKYHEALRAAELAIAWREAHNMRRVGDRRMRQTDAPDDGVNAGRSPIPTRCPTCSSPHPSRFPTGPCPDSWHTGV